MTSLRQAESGGAAPSRTPEPQVPLMPAVEPRGVGIPEWIKAKTGEGSVGDYLDHPLNGPSSLGLARALRGLTGLLGSLEYALIDVVIGLITFLRERAAAGGASGMAGPSRP